MAAEWSGVQNTTIRKYLKGASDGCIRKRLVLAMLKSKGKISYDNSGDGIQWQRRIKEHQLQSFGYGGSLDFSPLDPYVKFTVDWRGYKMTDMMHEKEKLMNRGAEALINKSAAIVENLTKDITAKFPKEMYADGYATGNDNRLCGFDSFTGTGTTVAADTLAQPSDTYGNVSTALGNKGGSWSTDLTTKPNANAATDWPSGRGDTEYDFNSPVIVNWSSTGWGTSATTWEANCERAIRQGMAWSVVSGGIDGVTDMILLSQDLFTGFKNHWAAKQRIWVPHKPSEDLGFSDTLNFEGCGLAFDYDVPNANAGYGWNFDQVELMCLDSQLFAPAKNTPYEEYRTDSILYKLGFWGNLKFESGKGFLKLLNVA